MTNRICHECGQTSYATRIYGLCNLCSVCALPASLTRRSCERHETIGRIEANTSQNLADILGDLLKGYRGTA